MKNIFSLLILLFISLSASAQYGNYCDTCVYQLSRDSLNRPAQQNGKIISPPIHKATMLMADKKMKAITASKANQASLDATNATVSLKASQTDLSNRETQMRSDLATKQRLEEIAGYQLSEENARLAGDNFMQTQINQEASARNLGDLLRLLKSDTASMLAPYAKKTTISTANNIAYVSKKYKTVGDADYLAQKTAQVIGSPVATFVNIPEARKALCEKLVAKEIERATIIVAEGTLFKVSEDIDTAGLGVLDYTYRTTIGNFYHPYPSSTTRVDDDSLSLSLSFPNLDFLFLKGSGITHLAGRGLLAAIYDTIAPQRISGLGSFILNVTNDRTNNGSGNGVNISMTGGYSSKGEFEFSGDSIVLGRRSPAYSGWTMLTGGSISTTYNFKYLSTYENNNCFRPGGAGNIIIGKFVTDTTSQPYTNSSGIYSPTGTFYPNGNAYNIEIGEAYIASNPIVYGNLRNLTFKVNKLTQKYRAAYLSNFVGTDQTSKPTGLGVAGTASAAINWTYISSVNANTLVTINSYRGQAPLLNVSGGGFILNSNVQFNFLEAYQDSIAGSPAAPKTSIYVGYTGGGSLANSMIGINANVINTATNPVLIEGNVNYELKGSYKTLSSVKSAIEVIGDNTNTKLSAAISVAGTQSSISGTGILTPLPLATANTSPSISVTTPAGTMLNVNSAYKY